jgi:hypothetical protein
MQNIYGQKCASLRVIMSIQQNDPKLRVFMSIKPTIDNTKAKLFETNSIQKQKIGYEGPMPIQLLPYNLLMDHGKCH